MTETGAPSHARAWANIEAPANVGVLPRQQRSGGCYHRALVRYSPSTFDTT
jgi:hypothetical protein